MSRKRPAGGTVHKLTVTFRSWMPQEEQAWRAIMEEADTGRSASSIVRSMTMDMERTHGLAPGERAYLAQLTVENYPHGTNQEDT